MKHAAFLFIFAVGLAGCDYVAPLVREFNIISVPAEIQIGEQAAAEVAKQMAISREPSLNSRVRGLGQQLVQALPRRDYDYAFFVVEDKTPNAFTIPGGKIYVHTGLLDFVDDDSELAGVMAHEIGHAYMRHPAKSLSRQYGVETLSNLLFKGNQSQMQSLAFKIAEGGVLNYYGRQDEFEADETGFYILQRSGLPTGGLLRFFNKLLTLQQGGEHFAFLSTHPPTPERIARLRALESGQQNPRVLLPPTS